MFPAWGGVPCLAKPEHGFFLFLFHMIVQPLLILLMSTSSHTNIDFLCTSAQGLSLSLNHQLLKDHYIISDETLPTHGKKQRSKEVRPTDSIESVKLLSKRHQNNEYQYIKEQFSKNKNSHSLPILLFQTCIISIMQIRRNLELSLCFWSIKQKSMATKVNDNRFFICGGTIPLKQ